MARPKRCNADYFSHDCDMRNDYKLKAVKKKYSHKGYAVWVMLLEVLASSDYFEYEWSELNKELLSSDFDLETSELEEIVDYFIKLNIIQLTNGYIHCERLTERLMDYLAKNREGFTMENSKRTSVNHSKTPKTDSLPMGNHSKTPKTDSLPMGNHSLPKVNEDSKEKKSKLNESKAKESKAEHREEQVTKVNEMFSAPAECSNSNLSFEEMWEKGIFVDPKEYLKQ